MIEGLNIDISTEELRALLKGRLEYHEKKRDDYKTRLEQLAQLEKGTESEQHRMSSSRTTREDFESSLKKHSAQATFYKFMSEHLVPGEVYRLKESDLERIGVAYRYAY